MLARCPTCRQTFSTDRTGPQDCPHCKRPLIVPGAQQAQGQAAGGPPTQPPEQRPPDAPTEQPRWQPPSGAPAEGEPAGTPWERRAELGNWEAWKQTMMQALFEPAKLFRSARLDRGRAQLGFALITGSVFWAVGQILDRLLLAGQREQMRRTLDQLREQAGTLPAWLQRMVLGAGEEQSIGTTIAIALLAPAIVFLLIYANAGLTHASALVLGQSRRGFAATFAACAYGLAPMALLAIPGCGGLIAPLWCIVLIGVGLKWTHRINPGGAAGAVLAPYVILCCGGCVLAGVVGALFGRAMTGGLTGQ